MRIIPNRTLYRCDHCTKHHLTKAAAMRHELFCRRNPENKHKCFDCEFLVRTDAAGAVGPDGKMQYAGRQSFTCAKFGHDMYTYVAERRNIIDKLGDATRMPLTCPGYEPEVFHTDLSNLPF